MHISILILTLGGNMTEKMSKIYQKYINKNTMVPKIGLLSFMHSIYFNFGKNMTLTGSHKPYMYRLMLLNLFGEV